MYNAWGRFRDFLMSEFHLINERRVGIIYKRILLFWNSKDKKLFFIYWLNI